MSNETFESVSDGPYTRCDIDDLVQGFAAKFGRNPTTIGITTALETDWRACGILHVDRPSTFMSMTPIWNAATVFVR